MPPYPWLFYQDWDKESTSKKISAMQTLGVPYAEGYAQQALADAELQAQGISASLDKDDVGISSDKEIVALIAYLQRLGTDIKNVDDLTEEN